MHRSATPSVSVVTAFHYGCRNALYDRTLNASSASTGTELLVAQVVEHYGSEKASLVVFRDDPCTSLQARPALKRLRRATRQGKIDRLFVSSLSRLHRNPSELLTFVAELVKHGCRLISINDIEAIENQLDLKRLSCRLAATAHIDGSDRLISASQADASSTALNIVTNTLDGDDHVA